MSAAPVGESRADDRPWRRGALVDAVKEQTSSLRPGVLVPRKLRMFPFTAPTIPTTVEPPSEHDDLGANYDTEWARKPAAKAARRVVQETVLLPALSLLTTPTIRGLDRIEHLNGPMVFAANHHSHLDIGMVVSALPRRLREKTVVAAAGDYFFDKRFKAMLSALAINAVPIERKRVSRSSMDQIASLLRDGWNLVIFPEGGRSPDGIGQEFKPGSTFLSIRVGCPIVPVHIDGTDQVFPKGSSLPKRGKCSVTFGHPITPDAQSDHRKLAAQVEHGVDALADEARTDWWSARQRAAAVANPSLRGQPDAASWRRQWDKSAGTIRRSKRSTSNWP